MEKIYILGNNGIFPIEKVDNIYVLFKKIVSGETMERGFSPFEVMEARGIICFKLAEHLERLFFNLKTCQIKIPYSADELSRFLAGALENAGLEESVLRLDVILGEEGVDPLFLLIKIRSKKEKKPLALKTFEFSRIQPDLKVSGGYVYAQIQKRLFPDYDDVLYLKRNKDGNYYFTETSRGNFFAVFWYDTVSKMSSKLIVYGVESSCILKGITRQTLLEADSKFSGEFIFKDKEIRSDELKFIKEAFVTSSSNRIIPVKKIDNSILDIGDDGQGGPITRRLSGLFDAYADEYYRKNTIARNYKL